MVIVAHRGSTRPHPENSIEALVYARNRGVEAIEIDVRQTQDGVFYLLHDSNLRRLFNIDREIASMLAEDVSQLTYAGSPGTKIARLESALEAIDGCCTLLVHVKRGGETLQRLVGILDSCKYTLKTIIGITTVDDLKFLKESAPNYRALGFIPDLQSIDPFLDNGVDIVRLWDNWVNGDHIRAVHEHGIPVWVMTGTQNGGVGETTAERIEELDAMEVDGIIINDLEIVPLL
jgi:glycerophosphoryl diester phosphodiesterase